MKKSKDKDWKTVEIRNTFPTLNWWQKILHKLHLKRYNLDRYTEVKIDGQNILDKKDMLTKETPNYLTIDMDEGDKISMIKHRRKIK